LSSGEVVKRISWPRAATAQRVAAVIQPAVKPRVRTRLHCSKHAEAEGVTR